ncbi:hypothetical protein D8674_031119 [Pyrus ussuriensis x Pyrus communis]|uniref:Uncharacterized protein n=1 Tax=Pyrus ussuriensis x Pyrus communis TaxID=2448454 RepID=A0A5N5EXM1_9ROSA|nr:hypothetical protein D8674_031119 [Pyrus ussuriensis x Pyrus communis]
MEVGVQSWGFAEPRGGCCRLRATDWPFIRVVKFDLWIFPPSTTCLIRSSAPVVVAEQRIQGGDCVFEFLLPRRWSESDSP